MSIEVKLVQDGRKHVRLRCDARAIHVAARGWPQWILDRGHEGGEHNLSTCERCASAHAVRSLLAEVRATTTRKTTAASAHDTGEGVNGNWAWLRFAYKAEDRAQVERSMVTEGEHSEQVRRQAQRYLRSAVLCARSRQQGLLKELRERAAVHAVHAGNGVPGQAMLCNAANMAAAYLWEEMRTDS
jgi:hypothetical protein